MKKLLLTAVLIGCGSLFFARGAQEIVKTGHWVYDALTSIALDGGYTDFTLRSPMTIQEIETYLAKADYEKLSAAGKKQFDRIKEYIAFEPAVSVGEDIFKISMTADLNLEGYYKSSKNLDWNFDRYSRKHVITAPMTMNAGNYASFGMETILGQNNAAMAKHDNYSNVPLMVDDCDLDFPDFAYFATGAKLTEKTGVGLQIAKGESSFNRSLSGSVTESEYFTGSTYVDFCIYSPDFRYKMNVEQFNVDKYMYTHEWGVIFWNKLQLTAREALLVYAPLELRYLNTIGIYHGFAPWRDYDHTEKGTLTTGGESHTCDLLSFKVEYTPAKHTRLYGVFAMDQFQMPNENSDTDCTPRAMAFQAGSESNIPYGEGYVHLWLEGTYTDPFMYIKGSPNWSLMRSYRESVSTKRNRAIYEWYGTPWGPDTAGGQLALSYEVPGKWSLGFDYLFKACGEYSGMNVFDLLNKGKKSSDCYNENNRNKFDNTSDWVYPRPEEDTEGNKDYTEAKRRQSFTGPHGTVKYVNRLALKGTYFVNSDWSFSVEPSFAAVFNNENKKGQNDYGWEVAFSTTYRLLK